MSKESIKLSRRDFLKITGATIVVGTFSAACQGVETLFQTPTVEEPTVKQSPLPTDVPPTPIPSPEFLPPVGGEKPEKPLPIETPKPTETPTPEPTSTPEPLSTYEQVLILKPGGMEAIGVISPGEIQEYQVQLKTLETAGMIPEAPEEGLSLLWIRSEPDSRALWATKIYSDEENPGVQEGFWSLDFANGQWKKRETEMKFVSGLTPYVTSLEEANLPPRYLGPEEGKVVWVLKEDPFGGLVAQASSPQTGEETGVGFLWGDGMPIAVFGIIPPYLPEGKVRFKNNIYHPSPTVSLKEEVLAIEVTDKDLNSVGFWNLEKGGWTPEPKNGVEYEELFEEPEPTPTPKPEEEVVHQWGGVLVSIDPELKEKGVTEVSLDKEKFPDAEQRLQDAVDLAFAHGIMDDMTIFAPFVAAGGGFPGGTVHDLDEGPVIAFQKEMAEKGLSGIEGAMTLIRQKRAAGEPVEYPMFVQLEKNLGPRVPDFVDATKPVHIRFIAKQGRSQYSTAVGYNFIKRGDGGLTIEEFVPYLDTSKHWPRTANGGVAIGIGWISFPEGQLGHHHPSTHRNPVTDYPWLTERILISDGQYYYGGVFQFKIE